MMEDAGEELSILLSRFRNGSDDDKSTLATRGLPCAVGLSIVAGNTFGGLLPTSAAITSPTFAVAGRIGAPLG
jgi:hypothetical protein